MHEFHEAKFEAVTPEQVNAAAQNMSQAGCVVG